MAISGAVLEGVFAIVMIVIWRMTGSFSALAAGLFLAIGVGAWLMVTVLFYCRELADRESIELEEIASGDTDRSALFERGEGDELRPARMRLEKFERWGVPIFTVLFAALHATVGILLFRSLSTRPVVELPGAAQSSLFVTIILFLGFLFSRYAIGMSSERQWRPLHATGSYMLVCDLFMLSATVSLLCAWQGYVQVDVIVAYVILAVQIVLAVEMAMSFLLDLYRPRVPGQEHRLSFDSRLFALVAEPGRVGHSIADTLNYQFGFDVSKTWFYQLFSRALVPLIIFGVVLLFAMSSIVIVPTGERHVVFRFGRLSETQQMLTPGIHLKLPWPVETTRRFNVGKVREIMLGAGPERTVEQRAPEFIKGREVFLWTVDHGPNEELDFLVAVSPTDARRAKTVGENQPTPPVNIIKLVAVVRYKIGETFEDIKKYGFKYSEPQKLLTSVAYREMTRYCASESPEVLMSYGRQRAAGELKKRIAKALGPEGLDMGVEITFVGFASVHPPKEVAIAYENVLAEERRQLEQRYKAMAYANEQLVRVAGDSIKALQLALAIRTMEELESLQQLRGDAAKFDAQLDEYIRTSKHDLDVLDKEIERERLLGMIVSGGKPTGRMILRENYAEHLEAMAKLRRRGNVDFAKLIAAARKAVDARFYETTGEAVALEAEALGVAVKTELDERAMVESFERELPAYKASPQLYMLDRTLDVWDEVLPRLTKYLLLVDRDKIEIRLDWQRKETEGQIRQPPREENKEQ